MSMYTDKLKMFADYRKELDQYTGKTSDPNEVDETCNHYINSKECTWKNVFDPESKELVGFLIIGKSGPERHPETERFIAHAYVKPEFRNRGFMTDQFVDYESRHRGSWGYFIHDGNDIACSFWDNLFRKLDYQEVDLDSSIWIGEEYHNLFGWIPKN